MNPEGGDTMKAVVDVTTVFNAWQEKLEFHRQKVKEYELKVAALKEAASMSNGGNKMNEDSQPQLGGAELSLTKSILKILRVKGGWMSVQELHDEILRQGFQTKSGNFLLLVSNTLQKMEKKEKLLKKKDLDGRKVKFALPGTLKD